jgi:phosphatidylglycerol:prolipoprotein diacylglycerol transferase
MYPTLPFGPLSLPTGPFVLLLATVLGLEMAGRYGRRLHLASDVVWNGGLLAILAGLFVARLWNVVEYWPIYLDEPLLILSIRPSGFVLWPGVLSALAVAYLYMLRKALDPVRMAAAYAVGALAAGIVLSAGAYLTGSVVGVLSDAPWALPYFGERRHPAALYQALGLWMLFTLLWARRKPGHPGRTVLIAALGYAVIRLFTDGFVDNAALIGPFRISQVLAFVAALALALLLARGAARQQMANHAPTTTTTNMTEK